MGDFFLKAKSLTLSLGIKDDMMEKYGEKLTNMCGGENTGWKSQKKINGR